MIANPQNINKSNLFERLGLPASGKEDGKEVSPEKVKEAFEINRTHWKVREKKVRKNKEKQKVCENSIKKLEQTYELLKTKEGIHYQIKTIEAQDTEEHTPDTSQQEQPKQEYIPKIQVSTSKIDFGKVNLKQSKTKEVIIKNAGSGELIWEISKHPKWLLCKKQGDKLIITFTSESENSFDDDIVIESNGGYARIAVTASAVSSPVLKLSQTTVNFGKFDIPNSKKTEINVTNTGTGKLEWKISNSPEWLKVKKVSDKIIIEFEPKKENNFNGNIEISSNGGNTKIPVNAQVNDPEKPVLQVNN